jgi:metal-responsive CopG/Arc/MetJ family transcriptional regulator
MKGIRPFSDRTVTLPVVVPMSWVDRLNRVAAEKGINRSAVIRDALEQAVFGLRTGEAEATDARGVPEEGPGHG